MANPITTAATQLAINAAKGTLGNALKSGSIGAAAIALNALQSQINPAIQNNYTTNNLTQFPFDLPNINGEKYCILFQFYQYNRPSILYPPTLTPYGAIALPIPSDLLDKSSISYSEEGSNLTMGVALENTGKNVATPSVTSGGIADLLSGLGIDAANALASKANVQKSLAFAGVAQNPFLSIQLNAPTYKRHVFTWTLIAETPQDVETLNYILNKIRYHSLVGINSTTGGVLLNYPDMCIPTLIPQGYMYDFKQCVVENLQISYAPGETPSFNTKNAPNAINLTVQLLEVEIWTKEDIAGGALNAVTPYASGA